MSLDERDYIRKRYPYIRKRYPDKGDGVFIFGGRVFRKFPLRIVMSLVAGFCIVGTVVWVISSVGVTGSGGCWDRLVPYVSTGLVVGCAMSERETIVGVNDSKWVLMGPDNQRSVASEVDSFMRQGKGGLYAEVRGDPSGKTYWQKGYSGESANPDQGVVQTGNRTFPGFGARHRSFPGESGIEGLASSAQKFLAVVFFGGIVACLVYIWTLTWVARDSLSRGMENPPGWVLLVAFVPVIGLIVYLLSRSQRNQ